MRYLKTYKSVNESTLGDLSFEDFQDLFVDITDKWDDVSFREIKDIGDKFYGISIIINIEFIEGNDFDILSILRDFSNNDDPLVVSEEEFVDIFDKIDDNIQNLYDLKDKIDSIMSKNKEIKKLIEEIKIVYHRLKHFSNYKEIQLAFDYDEVSLYYCID